MKVAPAPLEEFDELGVPPTVACANCGLRDCAGTCMVLLAPGPRGDALPWEEPGSSLIGRLFRTAELSALEPGLVFGRMQRSPLLASLAFGVICEGTALASLGSCALGALGAFAPGQLRELLISRWALGLLGLAWVAATLGMLLIHVLWGACMELGARLAGAKSDQARGFRFSMYSTGWDLLTSPAGIALSVVFRGFAFAAPLVAATRVARRAVDAYLNDCRGFDGPTRKRAVQVTTLAFVFLFLSGLGLMTWAFVHWIQSALA